MRTEVVTVRCRYCWRQYPYLSQAEASDICPPCRQIDESNKRIRAKIDRWKAEGVWPVREV